MSELDVNTRRLVSRLLSDAARDLDGRAPLPEAGNARRIGLTGPPGVGKSTLIGKLALERTQVHGPVAVLAVDPTSSVSGGSILGDRVRMDSISTRPDIFIRSVASRSAVDGLCDNAEVLLRVLDRGGFAEVILETVGVGQAQYLVSELVDTVVVVLASESGDSIQAMKAGLMELADVYVVNKSDRPDASRAAAEIRAALDRRSGPTKDWRSPVIMTSAMKGEGVNELSTAITAHQQWIDRNRSRSATERRRTRYHVQTVLERRLRTLVATMAPEVWDRPADEIWGLVREQLPRMAD